MEIARFKGKKIYIPVLLFQLSAIFSSAQSLSDRIAELYPRLEASQGESGMYELIEEELQRLGIPYRTLDFSDMDTAHSFSKNLEATIDGRRPDTLLVCIPISHSPDDSRERDGAINIEIALKILKQASFKVPAITLKILFLSAEFGEGVNYPLGSRLFLEDFYPEYPVIFQYMNLRTIPRRLMIRCGGNGLVSPNWLLERYSENLKLTDIPYLIRGNENQLFRMGLAEETIIEAYLKAGYPSVSFEGVHDDNPRPDREKWITSFMTFFWLFVDSYSGGIPTQWDRHYLFFQLLSSYLILPEGVYLAIILILLGLSIIYIQFFAHRFLIHLGDVIKYFWFILLLFLVWFILLLFSSYAIELVLWIRNSPQLWTFHPLLFLVFKILLSSFFFILISPLERKLPNPKQQEFFSSGALVLLFLNIVILAVIDISFAYYFLWAYTFVFLAASFKRRYLKLFFALLSPFWLVKGTIDMFTYPKLEFCRAVLLSKVWGNLLIAVFLIPFILLVVRMRYLFFTNYAKRKKNHLAGLIVISTASLAFFIFFLVFRPFSKTNPQEITAANIIDADAQTSVIRLESAAPLGEISFWTKDTAITVNTKNRTYIINQEKVPELLFYERDSTEILDRRNIDLRLRPVGRPYQLSLSLESENDFILYDANYPFLKEISGNQEGALYTILIGKHPPDPLELMLTLPMEQKFSLDVKIAYLESPIAIGLSGQAKRIRTRVVYHKRIDIWT